MMKGMGNMQKMMKQMQKMQKDMQKAQEELAEKTVEGTAGGGMVTVVVNGQKQVIDVNIKECKLMEDLNLQKEMLEKQSKEIERNKIEIDNKNKQLKIEMNVLDSSCVRLTSFVTEFFVASTKDASAYLNDIES